MNARAIGPFITGMVITSLIVLILFTYWNGFRMIKVHTLKAPLLLASTEPSKNLHLLPAGTTLYFDRSFPEGFTRYKVYINIDRMPLPLRDLSDPTEINPIQARPLDKSELAKALRDYPLTRQELEAILLSGHLTRDEVKEVLEDYLANTQ